MKIDKEKHMIIFFRYEMGNHKLTNVKSIVINRMPVDKLKSGQVITDLKTGQRFGIVRRESDGLLTLYKRKIYRVYNTAAKKYQFPSIAEATASKASKKLFNLIGKDAYKWRFEIRGVLDNERY